MAGRGDTLPNSHLGGSAGGHIVGQCATLLTNPAHAEQVGITASIEATAVRAMILDCASHSWASPTS